MLDLNDDHPIGTIPLSAKELIPSNCVCIRAPCDCANTDYDNENNVIPLPPDNKILDLTGGPTYPISILQPNGNIKNTTAIVATNAPQPQPQIITQAQNFYNENKGLVILGLLVAGYFAFSSGKKK